MAKAPVSDDTVKRATGRDWAEWCRVLDKAGASTMTHTAIAQMVHDKFDGGDPSTLRVPQGRPERSRGTTGSGPGRARNAGWWSQMITVGYERLRGLRVAGERPDGFEISRSKTIDAPIDRVYAAWHSPAKRKRWLADPDIEISTATPSKSLRFKWIDGTSRAEASFAAKGEKTAVTVSHRKIKGERAAEKMKKYWASQLQSLAADVGRAKN